MAPLPSYTTAGYPATGGGSGYGASAGTSYVAPLPGPPQTNPDTYKKAAITTNGYGFSVYNVATTQAPTGE